MTSREDWVLWAKLAESAERYKDMVENMKHVAESGQKLSADERNILSVAYKNSVGDLRESWRKLSSIEKYERSKGNESQLAMAKEFRIKVEDELHKACDETINVLDTHLIGSDDDGEAKVFYYKMKGDYLRYMAEFLTGDQQTSAANESEETYDIAREAALTELLPTHPIRLGLALNQAVFEYNIRNRPAKACQLAKEAFEGAIADLDTLEDKDYADATLIMQLLKDNLAIWRDDVPDE